jgi:hypothetical protein
MPKAAIFDLDGTLLDSVDRVECLERCPLRVIKSEIGPCPAYARNRRGRNAVDAQTPPFDEISSTLRARPYHEAVVGEFGHLPPKILVVAVGLHRLDGLLEIGILRRDLGPEFIGGL